MNNSKTQCTRCGTCCEKGGPALHGKDIGLVLEKQILPENLFTIRTGELVYDNVKGCLCATDSEIIKIRSASEQSACIYYDCAGKGCTIYEARPIECQVMTCWDTTAARAFYNVDRLDRASVFGQVDWIMELIQAHEEKCGYKKLEKLCSLRQTGDLKAAEDIEEALRYDAEIRRVVKEKTEIARMLDFVFGRPLEKTLPAQFGIRLKTSGQ
jgi:Fe-S-cluster containining protein